MVRGRRRLLVSFTLVAALGAAASCWWTPLEGPNFPPSGDPFFREGLPEIPSRKDEPVYRVVLAGDAGMVGADDPTLKLLGRWADELPGKTQVLFLGDNIYPSGLQDTDRRRGETVLLRQIRATRAPKIFVPGNHDWGYTGTQQLAPGVLANQEKFLEAHAAEGAELQPKSGCPGPAVVELLPPGKGLAGGLALALLDLHWWLLAGDVRPRCNDIEDTKAFLTNFRETLHAHRGRNLLVAAHHPIASGGPHGGQSRGFWVDLGVTLAYPFYRTQDIFEPGYQQMVRLLDAEMKAAPPLAMIGGHDHSLQILEGGGAARLVIVSGSASRVSSVTTLPESLFAHAHLGFVVMDFYQLEGGTEETLLVRVIETGKEAPVFATAVDLKEEDAPPANVADPQAAPAR